VALTFFAASIVNVHVVAVWAAQSPPHPPNEEPPDGVAVKITMVRSTNACEQSDPQSIPAGELVTAPCPGPALVTLS
jgi:hypothetical protein